jgi:catechol 2,3-dioxygenase-like lactoylglutathione lyase family enzyme
MLASSFPSRYAGNEHLEEGMTPMGSPIGIDRLLHVKVPVSNVERSARWYAWLLDLRLIMEFVEDDELRGVVLAEPVTGVRIALRDRAFSSSKPVLDGFDLIAFEMTSLQALEDFAQRCADLDIHTTGVHYFDNGASAGMDIPDPDGTALRFHSAPGRPPFIGYTSTSDSQETYQRPRLQDLPHAQESIP